MDPTSFRLMMAAGADQAPVFIAAATDSAAGSIITIPLTISKPAGTQAGDFMIAVVSASGNVTWTGATGWTEVLDQGASPSLRVAYKVAGASEPSNYTFTRSSGLITAVGGILTYRRGQYDDIGTISTSATASSINAASSSGILIAAFAATYSTSLSIGTTSGMTSRFSLEGNGAGLRVSDQLLSASGSTGTRTASITGETDKSCVLIALKPA